LIVSALATVFSLVLVYSAGVKFILFSCIVYATGTALYLVARRQSVHEPSGPSKRCYAGY
jgi:arginine:ornithine antiporter/lysine permease